MRYRCALFGFLLIAAPAFAQPGPDGYDFATIGAPGNRAYDGPDPFNLVPGRGSVNYEFKIGRTEVTTAQWMEFFNAALARPDAFPFVTTHQAWWGVPFNWGAQVDPTYSGPGMRFRLNPSDPNAAMRPVGGVSWRQAAMLCNWLHNDKGTAQSAFMNGAYDVTTFNPEIGYPTFNDQLAHHPNAKYWIPTLDEWMKSVHYDAAFNGGQGRWWQQPNGTDTPLIYGPPQSFGGDGSGMANAAFGLPNFGETRIPLGAYPNVQSPWGLLDAAGATVEWLETTRVLDGNMTRGLDGSFWRSDPAGDEAHSWGQESPHLRLSYTGFRIASAVPSPGSVVLLVGSCVLLHKRRR